MKTQQLPQRPFDRSQRLLFHHRRPVKDLVRGFVPGDLARDLDFRTLKRLPTDNITGMMPGEYEERTGDVLWRLRWRKGRRSPDQDVYVLILLELQSTCEEEMAMRVLAYVAFCYLRQLKDRPLRKGEKFPLILPIVLYNGDDLWSAPRNTFDLVDVVSDNFKSFVPSMEIVVVDEKRCRPEDLAALGENVVAAIVRAEQARNSSELSRVIRDLERWLEPTVEKELCRDFLAWFAKVMVPLRCPEADVPALRDFRELLNYVETDMPSWTEQARQEGAANVVAHMLENAYGPLPEDVQARVLEADLDQLLAWTDRVPQAGSLEDVFRVDKPN